MGFESGKIDFNNLTATEVASLSPEERAEYEKQLAMNRLTDINAGIEAGMQGNDAKLAELRLKFAEGRKLSGQLFKDLDAARNTYMTQATTVWGANRNLSNVQNEYNIWSSANQGYMDFKNGFSSDLSTFSGGSLGTPITDIGDTFQISNQGSFVANRVDKLSKNLSIQQQKYDDEQAILAQNKKERDATDRALDDQLWRNRMTVDEMEYFTNLKAMYTAFQNRQA